MSNRPKPTALKILQGNPGKRPLNKKEPKPNGRKPTCPNFLRGSARYEWDRVCDELHALGLLTGMDRSALAMYCVAYGTVRDAQAKIDELGLVAGGSQSPYVGVRNRGMELAHKFLTEFGMTPSSRSRMNIGKESADEGDEMKAWLDRAEKKKKAAGDAD